jgi:hypothetical protein
MLREELKDSGREPMGEPTMDAVTRRLERLERDNRRYKRVASLAVACVGLAVLLGAAPSKKAKIPDEVRAGRFVLVDKAGNAHAQWATTAEKQPYLVLSDAAGKPRLNLSLSQYGEPFLSFTDAAGNRRIGLSLDLYGVLLHFNDDGGKLRAALTVPAEGEPEIELVGKDDKVLWHVP